MVFEITSINPLGAIVDARRQIIDPSNPDPIIGDGFLTVSSLELRLLVFFQDPPPSTKSNTALMALVLGKQIRFFTSLGLNNFGLKKCDWTRCDKMVVDREPKGLLTRGLDHWTQN